MAQPQRWLRAALVVAAAAAAPAGCGGVTVAVHALPPLVPSDSAAALPAPKGRPELPCDKVMKRFQADADDACKSYAHGRLGEAPNGTDAAGRRAADAAGRHVWRTWQFSVGFIWHAALVDRCRAAPGQRADLIIVPHPLRRPSLEPRRGSRERLAAPPTRIIVRGEG